MYVAVIPFLSLKGWMLLRLATCWRTERRRQSIRPGTVLWRVCWDMCETGSFATRCWVCCCRREETPTSLAETALCLSWCAWCPSSTRIPCSSSTTPWRYKTIQCVSWVVSITKLSQFQKKEACFVHFKL